MSVDIPKLRKEVEWVEEQAKLPEIDREWEQSAYVSYAGSRADTMMWQLIGEAVWDMEQGALDEYIEEVELHCGTAYCVAGHVKHQYEPESTEHAAVVAQRLLGLSDGEAAWMFSAGNRAKDIRRIAEKIAGEKL